MKEQRRRNSSLGEFLTLEAVMPESLLYSALTVFQQHTPPDAK